MGGFYVHGPTLTYVTDPELMLVEQQRVIRQFTECAGQQMLRVAFRLPGAADEEVRRLLEWYLRDVAPEQARGFLLPPLVHNRPDVAASYEDVRLWMPARALDQGLEADAYSVHTEEEATRAVHAGAAEVLFGHVFASGSHPDQPPTGVDALRRTAERIRTDINTPVVTAIGGITPETVGLVGRARVYNVAVIRVISRSRDIPRTLARIRQAWVTALIDEDLSDPHPLAFNREWSIWHRWTADERVAAQAAEERNDQ